MEDYKEKLRLAKEALDSGSYDKETIEYIFPELKENEDEKIRKDLIEYFRWNAQQILNDFDNKEVLAWLEKQGEQKANEIHSIFRVGDYIRNKKTSDKVLIEQLDVKSKAYYYTSYDGGAEIHSDFPFSKQDEWELIGQRIVEQKPMDTTELEMKRHNEGYVKGVHDAYDNINQARSILKQLRKERPQQDMLSLEQKSQDKPALEVWKDMRFEVYQQASGNRHEPNYSDNRTKMFSLTDIDEIFEKVAEKQDKQKFVDKCKDCNNVKGCITCTDGNQYAHITEQKPADKVESKFKAIMADGYEWDAEKKELKKIEDEIEIPFGAKDSELIEASYNIPKGFHAEIDGDKVVIKNGEKPTECSEEDEVMLDEIIDFFENGTVKLQHDLSLYASWLKSLKERVQPQPKQEWSEEDKMLLEKIISDYTAASKSFCGHKGKLDWLKSLKERYTWKPSDEQMNILKEVLNFAANRENPHWNDYIFGTLYNLIGQLKKLREE